MTIFILLCVAMTLAALGWIAHPLLRSPSPSESTPSESTNKKEAAALAAAQAAAVAKRRRDRNVIIAVLAITMPVLSFGTYRSLSNFNWNTATMTAGTQGSPHGMDQSEIQAQIAKLESNLATNPQDIQGWTMLGRTYFETERFARAADAYEQAYKISGGNDVEIITSLAEALAMNDRASLASGRAGQLFEDALAKEPADSKALFYGGMGAAEAGKFSVARDRLELLLGQNPPPQFRAFLEEQIQNLNVRLGSGAVPVADKVPAAAAASSAGAAGGARVIDVSVNLSSDLLRQLPGPTPVFILVRDPAGGPPFAVERRLSAELPVTVRLDEQSAMVAGRSLATAPGKVQIVARIARSGTPQAQNGDFYGEGEYDFSQGAAGSLKVNIDRIVGAPTSAAAATPPPAAAPSAAPVAAGGRLLKVSVSIAPALASKLPSSAPVYVLARDPSGSGPPLAVEKHASSELPLTAELNESSAMVPGRSIANVPRVKVVARVSRSGSPIGQSGDLFGEAEYDFSKGATGSLKIVIDQTIP